MHFDGKLTWKQHVEYIKGSFSAALFAMRKVKHILIPGLLSVIPGFIHILTVALFSGVHPVKQDFKNCL